MSVQQKHIVQEINHMGACQLTFRGSLSYQNQQQLQQLRQILDEITLNQQDTNIIQWTGGMSEFTVKSHYKFMQQGSCIKSELHELWNIKAPPRVIIFSWLLMRNVILTIDNLKRKKIAVGKHLSRVFKMKSRYSIYFQNTSSSNK
jgi:zinc-binding in reverse transcriptase